MSVEFLIGPHTKRPNLLHEELFFASGGGKLQSTLEVKTALYQPKGVERRLTVRTSTKQVRKCGLTEAY